MSSHVFWVVFEGSARIFRLVASVLLFIFHLISQWIRKAHTLPAVCADVLVVRKVQEHCYCFPSTFSTELWYFLRNTCSFLVAGCYMAEYWWSRRASEKCLVLPQEKIFKAISIWGQQPVGPRSELLVVKPIKLSGNEMARPTLKKSAERPPL